MFLFDLASKKDEIQKYEEEINKQEFWDDNERAQKILQKNNDLKAVVEEYEGLQEDLEEIEVLIELGLEENDESIEKDIEKSIKNLENKIDKVKIKTLLNGQYDNSNAILAINAGTGGLDAQDCAQILLRMYLRWADHRGFKVQTLDMIQDPEAGIKSVTLLIEGLNAYGYLKSEKGVHRIVRISPFDASGKRHTSFVSVDVTPELDDSIEVDINPNDLKIDTYRSSGAGGQHVNKTDSAVRITHIPTGIVITCQNERSQIKNKETALKVLKSKLYQIELKMRKEKIDSMKSDHSGIEFGSQIRSYVFHPYSMIKDHRTGYETSNVNKVLDGNLDGFIESNLKGEKINETNKKN